MSEQITDNQVNAPQQGQAEGQAEDMFEQMYDEGTEVQESQERQEESSEQQGEVDDFLEREVEVAGQKMPVKDVIKSYSEARKKISQKTEKERYAEQVENALKQNPRLAKAMQLAQDENFATMMTAYEKGLINRDQLQQVKQYLNNKQNQQQPQQTLTPEKVQEMVSQQVSQAQKLMQVQSEMQREYEGLKNSEHGEIMQKYGVEFEPLAEYALSHKLYDENGMPSMTKALNHYAIDQGPDVFKTLMNMGKNEAQKVNQQKQQAIVESSSNRQQQSNNQTSPEDSFIQMLNLGETSGGGFPG